MAPTEEPPQPPAGESIRLDARASDHATINQAARDLHVSYGHGVGHARRAEAGAKDAECPYPGLLAFGRGEARWFFGREQLTAQLVKRLDQRLSTGGVQVVVAPSGAGKSSLLHAGLLAKLDEGALPGSSAWPVLSLTPTADPLAALQRAAEAAELLGPDAHDLTADPQALIRVVRDRIGGERSAPRVVVVVDQFEELFTLCADEQQQRAFIELLLGLAEARALVVLGVRADFYATCANYPPLREALQDRQLLVGPMSQDELREAIRYPAQNVGLDVEEGLVELLLRDLADTEERGMASYAAGRLPLLAHALRSTWQQRHGHVLSVEGYRTTGGIHQAVATTAEDVYTGLDEAGRRVARTLFLRLVKIGDGGADTRRRVARAELLRGLDGGAPVVDAFTGHRLLTQDRDTVEITHEALLHAWPRLTEWIGEDRAGHLIRQTLDDDAAGWDRNHRDSSALYRGSRLEAARAWAAATPNQADLSPTASAFLAASTHQSHRAARVRRAVIVVLSVLALLASATAAFALQQRAVAQDQRDVVVTDQIAAQADQLRGTNAPLAAQLDLLAYRIRPATPDLSTALISTGGAALFTSLAGATDSVSSVAFSPDGRTLATGSADATVRLWNVADPARPTPLSQLSGHTNAVFSVAFSPDGRTLATGSGDQTVRLWNVADPARPTPLSQPLTGYTHAVNSVAFSPDGHTLATGSDDKTVRLWNVTDPTHPTPLSQLSGHTDTVFSVAFSPKGHTLATGSIDKTVRLWDIPSTVLSGYAGAVFSVAFSPDGRTLATGSDDATVRLWNVADPARPTPLSQLSGHTNAVFSVAFSPDGRTLATGSDDKTVRLWNVADPARPTPLSQLSGHTDAVFSVAFSPDGHTLATGSNDQTVRLWNVTGPARPTPLGQVAGYTDSVRSVAFSPDGHTLATGSNDQTARLWNVTGPARPTLLGQLTGHTGPVNSVAFSPGGHTLATGSDDSTVRLWDLDIDHAIRRICATTANNLTPAAWRQYVPPTLPYHPPCP